MNIPPVFLSFEEELSKKFYDKMIANWKEINMKTINNIRQELVVLSLLCSIPPQRTATIASVHFGNNIKDGKGNSILFSLYQFF